MGQSPRMVLAQKDDGLNHFSAEIDHLLLTSCVTNVNLPEARAQPPRLRLSKAQVRRAVLAVMSDGPTAQASQWLEKDDGKTLDDRTSTKPLPQRNQPIQAFLFDGPNKTLRMRIAVRSTERSLVMPTRLEQLTNRKTPFPIAVANQDAVAVQHALARCGQLADNSAYEGLAEEVGGRQRVPMRSNPALARNAFGARAARHGTLRRVHRRDSTGAPYFPESASHALR
jgi:hypothetical protein